MLTYIHRIQNYNFLARNQYTGKIREAASTYKTNLALKLNEGIKTDPKSWWQIASLVYGKEEMYLYPGNAMSGSYSG